MDQCSVGTKYPGRCREVLITVKSERTVGRKTPGRCKEVAVSGGSIVAIAYFK